MSRRLALQQRIHTLTDIDSIMAAMKNLSLIETRKLARVLGHQQKVLANIQTAAADFLQFHPQPAPPAPTALTLAIGSERGFCGDFNEEVVHAVRAASESARFLVVGNRLGARLEGDPRVVGVLAGPSVTEEVGSVLAALTERLEKAAPAVGSGLEALCHAEDGKLCVRSLAPMPVPAPLRRYSDPPLLNLPPLAFFRSLAEHYLLAALQQIFHASLMAENRRRLQHMEGAIRQVERTVVEATLKSNALRQEEITEEIEIIMLSADAVTVAQGVR